MKFLLGILMIITPIYTENVLELELTPEEAVEYMANHQPTIEFAKLISEKQNIQSPTEQLLGRKPNNKGRKDEFDDSDNFIEETYIANQYHGQDGLGAAIFGFKDWNQGRFEERQPDGSVRGGYEYKIENNVPISINFRADANGFQQVDSDGNILLQPVTETPEVQAARKAHEAAWLKASLENRNDPYSDIYNANAIAFHKEQTEYERRIKRLSAIITKIRRVAKHAMEVRKRKRTSTKSAEEISKEPRGFYYNHDYEVKVKQPRNA